jgi:hypothetical protein
MKLNGRLILFTIALVAIATACKLYFGPNFEWSGFSPVIAIALFSGFIIKQKDNSFLLPLLALFFSDVSIQVLFQQGLFDYPGFYGGQWKNYAILLISTLIGWGLKGRSYGSLLAGGLLAPTVFFLVSNLMVWTGSGAEAMYPKTFSGLMLCYEAGLPFFKNSVMATLVFVPVIALAYNLMTQKKAEIRLA